MLTTTPRWSLSRRKTKNISDIWLISALFYDQPPARLQPASLHRLATFDRPSHTDIRQSPPYAIDSFHRTPTIFLARFWPNSDKVRLIQQSYYSSSKRSVELLFFRFSRYLWIIRYLPSEFMATLLSHFTIFWGRNHALTVIILLYIHIPYKIIFKHCRTSIHKTN